jgi:predicted nucleotidyltransferase
MSSPSFRNDDRRLLDEFRDTVKRHFGENIREILVFGSKARGDATEDSDLDILVLIEDGDWRLKDEVADVAYELAIGTNVVPSVMVYTIAEWSHLDRVGSPFRDAVMNDAVAA